MVNKVRVSEKNLAKKPLTGKIVRISPEGKTAKVRVDYTITHERYGKILRRYTDYLAHLESEVQLGQEVKLFPCRRLSKRKSWLVQV